MAILGHNPQLNDEAIAILVRPVVQEACHAIARSCTTDCDRVIADFLEDFDAEAHWKKFFVTRPSEEEDTRYLVIEKRAASCNIALGGGPNWSCPLFGDHRDWHATLRAIEPVLRTSVERAAGGRGT